MPLTLPDILQRGAAITSIAACGYASLLIAQGFTVRAQRRKDLEAKMEGERSQMDQELLSRPPPNMPS